MNENRETILQGLYAVRKELGAVLHYEQELQNLSSQLRTERKTFQSTTIRAKFNQMLAAFCVAVVGTCMMECLLTFRFADMLWLALLAFLVYKFFSPKRYQDKKLNIFRIGLSLLSILLIWDFVKELGRSISKASVWGIISWIIYGVTFTIISIVVYRLLTKKRLAANMEIAEDNEAIRTRNEQLRTQYAAAQGQLNRHSQEVQQLCAGWFPMNYCYMYAIECFIRYLENYQADTVKEMVNLFEDSEHKRRMEEAQRETQRQIQFMTLTGIMNSWAIQDTMNRNTDSINRTINSAADRIRQG